MTSDDRIGGSINPGYLSPDSLARQRDLEAVDRIARSVMEEFDVRPDSPYFAYHTFLRAIKSAASRGIVIGREIDSSEPNDTQDLALGTAIEVEPGIEGLEDAPLYW